MVQSQYSLSWDYYKSNICTGFSSLQQNGEFVDMTLAADGHFVKVHQVIIALSSPYLKTLMSSAPCQHPVIFLNNVSHKTLSQLLEYMYTGEVLVPADSLTEFAEAARSLCIKGLENITGNDTVKAQNDKSICDTETVIKQENPKHSPIQSTWASWDQQICLLSRNGAVNSYDNPGVYFQQVPLPYSATNVLVKKERSHIKSPAKNVSMSNDDDDDYHDYGEAPLDDSGAQDSDDGNKLLKIRERFKSSQANTTMEKMASKLQFSVSIRGALQIVLNRYIYNFTSKKRKGVRRWRCVDYRSHKCTAFVVTKDNVVLNRGNPHNHAFHDKKILAKIEKKTIFSQLEDIKVTPELESKKYDDDSSEESQTKDYLEFNITDENE